MSKQIYAVTRTGTKDIVHISGTLICTTPENTPTDQWIRDYVTLKCGVGEYSIFRLIDQDQIDKINSHLYDYTFDWDGNELIGVTLTLKPE